MFLLLTKPQNVSEAFAYTFDVLAYVSLTVAIALLCAIVIIAYVLKRKNLEKNYDIKKLVYGTLIGFSISTIPMLATLKILYNVQTTGKYISNYSLWFAGVAAASKSGMAQLYIYTILLVALLFIIYFVVAKKQTLDKTKSIVFAAILIALGVALSYIKLFALPQGGIITFASLLPIMIYSYVFGARKGVLVGAIFGVLMFFQEPFFVHPVQFLLDYPIAFAMVGLTGLFQEKKIFQNKQILAFTLGAILAVLLRYISHVISGIFVFGSGDLENYSAVAWSFLYNLFAFADMAISLTAGFFLLSSRSFKQSLEQIIPKSSVTEDSKNNELES